MRKFISIAILLVMALAISSCAESAAVDKIGLRYGGGPFEGNHFENVVEPGSGAQWLGPADSVVWLPFGQRTYDVSKRADQGDESGTDFISVPAQGGILMDFELTVYFKLNTHTDDIEDFEGGTLRRFYEQICKKYNCTSGDGWDKLLREYFRRFIDTSMREKVAQYGVEDLYSRESTSGSTETEGGIANSSDIVQRIQDEIAAELKDTINENAGGEYFCGPAFDRDEPECPDFEFIINSAVPHSEAVIESFNDRFAATNRAQARRAEAEGIREAQEASQVALTPEYIRLLEVQALNECAKRTGCTLVFTPGGTNVNVNAGG